ncbi:MAG TPA: hypothetical protein VL361_20055 [Candidatus Limnocylindrales bacterium]|nr:hypothetical protein [Candidatus Limnocylindrales bacterium]
MNPNAETLAFNAAPETDSYDQAVVRILGNPGAPLISVPDLAQALEVKATTLNARFRRQQISVATVGRTNFIPISTALELAKAHKYALLAWPTLREASQLTGVKPETIKARCEKGRLEGYLDLTKRLRINPTELEGLKLTRTRPTPTPELLVHEKRNGSKANLLPRHTPSQSRATGPYETANGLTNGGSRAETIPELKTYILKPASPAQIQLITEKDYGLWDAVTHEDLQAPKPKLRQRDKKTFSLSYDPERPFSVSDCAVGRAVTYGQHAGVIAKIIDDPFSPKIQVRFPEHAHPLMREVLLVVDKRKK